MSFRDRSKSEGSAKIVLPITPMLDMTFQLLFFFIVNFRPAPSTIEGQIDMGLPSDSAVANPNVQKERPDANDKDPLEFKADLTVKVRPVVDNVQDGEISSLFLMDSQGKESPVDGGLKGLREALIAKRNEMGDADAAKKTNIKVQAGGKLK